MKQGIKMMLMRSRENRNGEHYKRDYDIRNAYDGRSGTYYGDGEEMRRRSDYTYNMHTLPYYPAEYKWIEKDWAHPERYGRDMPMYNDYDRPESRIIGFDVPRSHYGTASNDSAGSSKINNTYMFMPGRDKNAPLSKEDAMRWVKEMENSDGTTGQHWAIEQTEAVREQLGIKCEPVEFYAAMNAMYSDYCKVAKKFGVDTPEFYAKLACAFLDDKDAVPHKLAAYYNYVVEH